MSKKKNDFSMFNLPNANLARKRLVEAKILREEYEYNPSLATFGKGLTYHIRTYGCQSNVRDTEIIKGILEDLGFSWNTDIYNSDLVLLNTCAIRESAENKVYGELGFLKKAKKHNPAMMLGISGCMSQSEKVVNTVLTKYQHVDFIFGTHNIHKLPEILNQVRLERQVVVDVWSQEGDVIEGLPSTRDSKFKAWVNIMYGCDNFCSYCIVPYTRGKIRSRAKEDILSEIKALVKNGYKEVTLLGQNVNAYGIDLQETINFAQLLELVAQIGIPRIRFATSNPWNWDPAIVDVAKKYPNIMPYFHLPIQSGSEEILLKMNRQMKIADYIKQVKYIRDSIPNCAISTDLIVGFPNESDEQFKQTLTLYQQVQYDNAYTFIFSARENTPAAKIPETVSLETKQQRLHQLNELVKHFASLNNQKYVGQIVQVLVDGMSKSNPDKLTGYTPTWKVVNFNGEAAIGEIVNVEIQSASRFSLNGVLVSLK